MRIHIVGLDDSIRHLDPARINAPLRRFFLRSVIYMQGRARQYAPVDRGQLRNAIIYDVQARAASVGVLRGAFSTPLGQKAFAMEYGSGDLSDAPPGQRVTHLPAAGELDVWARRHGFESGAQVANIIARRGGVAPRRYMRRAMQDGQPQITRFLQILGDEIGQAMVGGYNHVSD